MRCKKARRWLSAERDGQLDERRRQAAGAHLNGCPGCRRFVEGMERASRDLAALPAPEPRPDFVQRVLARLPEQREEQVASVFRPMQLAAAGLGLAAGIVMAVLMNGEQAAVAVRSVDATQAVYTDSFEPLPNGSAAGRYVAMLVEGGR